MLNVTIIGLSLSRIATSSPLVTTHNRISVFNSKFTRVTNTIFKNSIINKISKTNFQNILGSAVDIRSEGTQKIYKNYTLPISIYQSLEGIKEIVVTGCTFRNIVGCQSCISISINIPTKIKECSFVELNGCSGYVVELNAAVWEIYRCLFSFCNVKSSFCSLESRWEGMVSHIIFDKCDGSSLVTYDYGRAYINDINISSFKTESVAVHVSDAYFFSLSNVLVYRSTASYFLKGHFDNSFTVYRIALTDECQMQMCLAFKGKISIGLSFLGQKSQPDKSEAREDSFISFVDCVFAIEPTPIGNVTYVNKIISDILEVPCVYSRNSLETPKLQINRIFLIIFGVIIGLFVGWWIKGSFEQYIGIERPKHSVGATML